MNLIGVFVDVVDDIIISWEVFAKSLDIDECRTLIFIRHIIIIIQRNPIWLLAEAQGEPAALPVYSFAISCHIFTAIIIIIIAARQNFDVIIHFCVFDCVDFEWNLGMLILIHKSTILLYRHKRLHLTDMSITWLL